MACPLPQPDPCAADRPPPRGWYWNANHLARAWLPLIGPEGLGLLDFYLATADHRPGASAPGWAAVTLDELARLTGWGRARLVRLNRLLAAAGLLTVRHRPVPGHGPAVQRAFYRVERQAPPPTAAALSRLAPLAERDPALAARLRRYTLANPPGEPPAVPVTPPATVPPAPGGEPGPVAIHAPVPVPCGNRSEDATQTAGSTTTTSAHSRVTMTEPAINRGQPAPDTAEAPTRAVTSATTPPAATAPEPASLVAQPAAPPAAMTAADGALDLWQAANGRPASALERQRLGQLAALVARAAGGDAAAGWTRVGEAIVEAVEAGSAYVAPRRVARILERWLAGDHADAPPAATVGRESSAEAAALANPPAPGSITTVECAAVSGAVADSAAPVSPTWAPPVTIAGLPAAPAAVLRAALTAAGLSADPYLRGAVLAGWADAIASDRPALLVATLAPAPPAIVARLQPRLIMGLSAVLGRPVGGQLTPVAALATAAAVARGN
ncbi:MAG: hypothetical protein IT340_15140 [Chloroflexi bacterium]|nr:hypothetical protein [Chloroflexota bacterium]